MRRIRKASFALFFGSVLAVAQAADHPAQGLVLKVNSAHRTLLVSCNAIPGYMAAMEMPLKVREAKAVGSLQPGMMIRFTLHEEKNNAYAEDIQPMLNFEAEPAEAEALTALRHATSSSDARQIAVGEPVPDFTLTDQAQQPVSLSSLRGKVVLITFGYSRCPNPNYCYRLSSNLRAVARRLHNRLGTQLVLITIDIDPEVDSGSALAAYAQRFHADPHAWHFLTGPLPEIQRVASMFGMDFWESEGTLTHTLRTIVIARDGALAANLEGNAFSARQLEDLVVTTLRRPAAATARETAPLQ